MTTENKEIETKKAETATKTVEVTAPKKEEKQANDRKQRPSFGNRRSFGGPNRKGQRRNQRGQRQNEYEERVVNISRVTNVVKGGRRFSFSTLVVIGNKKGKVAYGHGKAKEVPESIKKAIKDARRNLIKTPIVKGTIPHITQAKYISSNVLLKPAPKGKGIIASGAVRAVVELAGYKDIVTKSLGSSNKANTVKATLKALTQLKTAEERAALRDKDVTHFG